jgi:adenosine kinase
MSFPGKFSDSLVVDALDKLSLSFLVEDLEVRRGGCAANICFGLGNLGLRPVLVGAVGEDFGEYRSWLERHNVDCDHVHVSETRHTARFVCTNDSSMAQIASFYAGGHAPAHRRVPPARLPVRRRPVPAARLR